MNDNKTVLTPQEIHDLADAMPWEDVADIGAYWHESVRIIERAVLAKLPGMPADAWMHEDDPQRVISASQKAGAEQDGGASASSVKPYSIALGRIHPAPSEATGKLALQVGASEADPVIRNPLITASEAGAVPVSKLREQIEKWVRETSVTQNPPKRPGRLSDKWREGMDTAAQDLRILIEAAPPSTPAAQPVSARHPTVVKWRNSGIEACAKIADDYGMTQAAIDMRVMLTEVKGGDSNTQLAGPASDSAFHSRMLADSDLRDDSVASGAGKVNTPAAERAEPVTMREWRCFHCDAIFITEAGAAEHFGKSEAQQPACTIDVAEYRAMEARMQRYAEEDTDLHRDINRLRADHSVALRREEEAGYARGLADGKNEPTAATADAQPLKIAAPCAAMYKTPTPDDERRLDVALNEVFGTADAQGDERAALQTLVDLEDMRLRLRDLHERGHGTDYDDYRKALPKAWDAARAALSRQPSAPAGALVDNLHALAKEWMADQAGYPNTEIGRHAAAAVKCCANELRAALAAAKQGDSNA